MNFTQMTFIKKKTQYFSYVFMVDMFMIIALIIKPAKSSEKPSLVRDLGAPLFSVPISILNSSQNFVLLAFRILLFSTICLLFFYDFFFNVMSCIYVVLTQIHVDCFRWLMIVKPILKMMAL